jgi:hypothetical protein
MFELAMNFLANPWKLRNSPRLEDKRTVLKLTFSDGLAYQRGEGFRTPKTSMPFRALGGHSMGNCEMAVLSDKCEPFSVGPAMLPFTTREDRATLQARRYVTV